MALLELLQKHIRQRDLATLLGQLARLLITGTLRTNNWCR
jgi:predicted transposase YdaD